MVCEKCEKKLGKVITPDPWKAGGRAYIYYTISTHLLILRLMLKILAARNTTEQGGRKLNENKALTSSKNRFNPYTPKFEGCRICKQKVHQAGSYYCKLIFSVIF